MITIALLIAAALVLVAPRQLPLLRPAAATVSTPSFLTATADLATVRRRLVDTSLLGDPERKAIDTLQLALTAGSDQ